MSCLICHEEPGPVGAIYCLAHQRAFENIKQAFMAWTIAYGSLSVPDFLQRLQKLFGTGQKAKEIAHFLSENPSRWQ
jgi:hypothetical protein